MPTHPTTSTATGSHAEKRDPQSALQVILMLLGNVDHSIGNGPYSAKMRGDLLNDIRDICNEALNQTERTQAQTPTHKRRWRLDHPSTSRVVTDDDDRIIIEALESVIASLSGRVHSNPALEAIEKCRKALAAITPTLPTGE